MPMSRLFAYQDYIWSSHGVTCLKIKSVTKRHLLKFLRVFSHLYLIQHLLGCLSNVVSTGDLMNVFPFLYITLSYIFFIISTIQLNPTVNEIINFAERFLTIRIKRQLIKIEIYSLIGFIIWFVLYAFIGLSNHSMTAFYSSNETENFDKINYWVSVPKENILASILYLGILTVINCHKTDVMIVANVFIYCYLVFVIYTIKKSFIDYVIRNKTSIKEFRIIWMEIIAIQDTLEENLSTIPFLSIVTLFMNATTIVVFLYHSKDQVQDNTKEILKSIIQWGFEIGIAIPILSMPFLITWTEKRLEKEFKLMQKKMFEETTDNPELTQLMDEIKSNLDLNLTGWSMFKLNRELVLAFISSVVTFSVLFLQLTQHP